MISTRHTQANSPSFPDTYDSSLPNQNLIYLDANNLYGWAMSQSLPTHGFRFLQQDEISALKLQELSHDAEDDSRWIFTIQLTYMIVPMTTRSPPESLVIYRSMYSSTQQAVFPESAPQRKLTPKPNLRDKVKYVVHYRNLKLYLQLGLVVTKVHRVTFNTRQRS